MHVGITNSGVSKSHNNKKQIISTFNVNKTREQVKAFINKESAENDFETYYIKYVISNEI